MVVSQSEIDLILRSKFARRQMRLPVTYDSEAMPRHCPVRLGGVYQLRTIDSPKVQATISVTEVHRDRQDALSASQARREGFNSIDQAQTAFCDLHGPSAPHRPVWVITFALSEALTDQPVFLSKDGGYTTAQSRQAVLGDPEVMLIPGASETARVMALAKRDEHEREAIRRQVAELETLSEAMSSMKARNLLRRAARTIEAAQRVLLSEQVLDSGLRAALAGTATEADRPSSGASLATP